MTFDEGELHLHPKSGRRYFALITAIDCNNSAGCGKLQMLYILEGSTILDRILIRALRWILTRTGSVYVRNLDEFRDKFRMVDS